MKKKIIRQHRQARPIDEFSIKTGPSVHKETYLFFCLGWVPNFCGHTPAQTVIHRVHDTSRTQHQWVTARIEPISVILIGAYGLSLPHTAD